MAAGYSMASAATAFSGVTNHAICNVINSSTGLVRVTAIACSTDGVTSSAVPGLVGVFKSTQATAGTAGAATFNQVRGPTRTAQSTAGTAYTTDPTALTITWQFGLPQYNGLVLLQFPLGREPEQTTASNALGFRYTSTATVNVYGSLEFEEG